MRGERGVPCHGIRDKAGQPRALRLDERDREALMERRKQKRVRKRQQRRHIVSPAEKMHRVPVKPLRLGLPLQFVQQRTVPRDQQAERRILPSCGGERRKEEALILLRAAPAHCKQHATVCESHLGAQARPRLRVKGKTIDIHAVVQHGKGAVAEKKPSRFVPTGSGGGIAPVKGSAQQCVQELLPACGVVRVRDADTRAAALCRPHLGQERTAVAVRMDDVIAAVPHDAGKPGCIGDGVSIPHGQHEHAPAQPFHACAKVCVRFVDRNNVRQEALPRRFHGGKRIGGDAVRRKARRQDFKCANLPFHCPNAFNSSGA